MFNARAESIDSSRAYRGPFRHHRAVIPATSFIEWQKRGSKKQPYEIKPTEGCFLLAAIWDVWTDGDALLYSCSMVTTAAVDSFTHIHHRQPLMLSMETARQWLDPRQETHVLRSLLKSSLPAELQVLPISAEINNARTKCEPQTIELDEDR